MANCGICGKNAGWFHKICTECLEKEEAHQLAEIRKTRPLYHRYIKAIISFTMYGMLGIGCSTITRIERGWVVDETEKTVRAQFEPLFEWVIYVDILKSEIIEIED